MGSNEEKNPSLSPGSGVGSLHHFLLDSLPQAAREKLLKDVVFTTLPAERYVFHEGDPADFICIIRTGQVKLSRMDSQGRENIVMFLSENETIWESLFLYEGRFPYSAITMTKTQLCQIYRENFLQILDDPQASLQIISMLSRKLHDANERSLLLSTKEPYARVAGFLLYHLERTGSPLIQFHLEEIASSIDLRSETVSRKLGELASKHLVQREGRGKIRILDSKELRRIFREE